MGLFGPNVKTYSPTSFIIFLEIFYLMQYGYMVSPITSFSINLSNACCKDKLKYLDRVIRWGFHIKSPQRGFWGKLGQL